MKAAPTLAALRKWLSRQFPRGTDATLEGRVDVGRELGGLALV